MPSDGPKNFKPQVLVTLGSQRGNPPWKTRNNGMQGEVMKGGVNYQAFAFADRCHQDATRANVF